MGLTAANLGSPGPSSDLGFGKAGPSARVRNSWTDCGTESEKKPWTANRGLLLLGKASVH